MSNSKTTVQTEHTKKMTVFGTSIPLIELQRFLDGLPGDAVIRVSQTPGNQRESAITVFTADLGVWE